MADVEIDRGLVFRHLFAALGLIDRHDDGLVPQDARIGFKSRIVSAVHGDSVLVELVDARPWESGRPELPGTKRQYLVRMTVEPVQR